MIAIPSAEAEVARSNLPPELRSTYRTESLDLCRRAARTACILWIAVTPAFAAIDYARYPDLALLFLLIRGVYVAVNGVLLALLSRPIGSRYPREIALLSTASGGILIFALMSYTGGHTSPYANGMGLLILGMALLMPWSPTWSTLATAVLVATYGAYAWIADPQTDVRSFVNNAIGFGAAGAIGAVSAVARERLRWREFKNRYAFERTHAERCESEAHLRREVDANRQLIDALEQANRVRAEFVSTMSHELRTPLHVMIGLAEMARDPGFDAGERESLLERLRQAAVRLLELVDGTLEIGKIEAGRHGIETREISIAGLWAHLEQGCADLVPRAGVAMHWQEDSTEGVAHTDPRKLLVIVRNLLGNALKFTDQGHVCVRLGGDPSALTIAVEDTGIGIPPEDHDMVFEMFRQADSSETRRFEGCGLGLYIVRQLAQRLGGSVCLTSEPGRGTTVAVSLPREPTLELADAPALGEVNGRQAA